MIIVHAKKFVTSLTMMLIILLLGCKGEKSTAVQPTDFMDNGKMITAKTFMALSSELQRAMADGGVPSAVKYCNLKALPITDSLSAAYNVQIRRTSDRVRNPQNIPSSAELNVIQAYQADLSEGKQLVPHVVEQEAGTSFYAPIVTNDLCLKCHGAKQDIQAYDVITDLYPDDLATDYQSGELRGIWSVHFLK